MTIVYGTKSYVLQQIFLPVACHKCGHPDVSLFVTKLFFTICYIPILPLHKKVTIFCHKCGHEIGKRRFLKELPEEGKESIRQKIDQVTRKVKVPLKYYTPGVLALIVACGMVLVGYRDGEKQAELIKQYREDPQGNALVAIKMDDEDFPYTLIYVTKIDQENVVFYPWSFSFSKFSALDNMLATAEKQIKKGELKNFGEERFLSKEEFLQIKLVKLKTLS